MSEATLESAMRLRFWGVRGSLPTPGPGTLRYGGNTCCVELRCGPHLVVLDAGSGLRECGHALVGLGAPVSADLLLSHTHLDHICGLPFFPPIYDRRSDLRLWSGPLAGQGGIEAVLRMSWNAPVMPNLGAQMRAGMTFHDIGQSERFELQPGLAVSTCALHHPGGATGYRIEWCGRSVCYITDTEHRSDGVDPALTAFVSGADIMIYDACYTEAEYATRIGWGHSTWRAGVALAEAASVGRLVLFHHDPGHDDDMMDEIAALCAQARAASVVARDGMVIDIG